MRLYELTWGPFPRRVLIYIAEKGLTGIERVEVDVLGQAQRKPEFLEKSPLGYLPVLEVKPGVWVRQSMPIIEYLEDRFPDPDMIGETPEERAATREMVGLVNEAYNLLFGFAKQVTPVMAGYVDQRPDYAAALYSEYLAAMGRLETMASGKEFLCGDRLTIADCAFFPVAQYAQLFYDIPLPAACPKLAAHVASFAQRPSAQPPQYPEMVYPAGRIPRAAIPS